VKYGKLKFLKLGPLGSETAR